MILKVNKNVKRKTRGFYFFCVYFFIHYKDIFKVFCRAFRITSRLYATLPTPYKATRRVAGVGNVGEGGVGMSVANDLAD